MQQKLTHLLSPTRAHVRRRRQDNPDEDIDNVGRAVEMGNGKSRETIAERRHEQSELRAVIVPR